MINSDGRRIKIAYVEDEPSIAQLLVSGMGLFGIDVSPVFKSAEALLEDMDNPEFTGADLLFLDIRLPRMTGLELAYELRRRGEIRPFILVSAWPAPAKAELTKLGATFLPKPFDFSDMIKTIQQLTRD
jgi:DNA-binding response OmpR family regulator